MTNKDEYIDYLHERIQFLETELEASEKTVLELKQELDQARKRPRGRNTEALYRGIVEKLEEEARKREEHGEKVGKANEAIERMQYKINNVYFPDRD